MPEQVSNLLTTARSVLFPRYEDPKGLRLWVWDCYAREPSLYSLYDEQSSDYRFFHPLAKPKP